MSKVIKAGNNWITPAVDLAKYLVDRDEAFGVHVDAALFQETCCRNTSCTRGDEREGVSECG